MAWFGSQMNGYSVAAIPSVAPVVVQPSCTIRAISKITQLVGSRSIRAAISPGITRLVVRPAVAPVPEASCAIAILLAATKERRGKAGCGAFAGDGRKPDSVAAAGHNAGAFSGFGAGQYTGAALGIEGGRGQAR